MPNHSPHRPPPEDPEEAPSLARDVVHSLVTGELASVVVFAESRESLQELQEHVIHTKPVSSLDSSSCREDIAASVRSRQESPRRRSVKPAFFVVVAHETVGSPLVRQSP